MTLLILSLVGTALVSVWLRNDILRIAHETKVFQGKKKDLLQNQRELIVRISQLRRLERIESIAADQLGMKPPDQDQQIYVSAQGAIVEGNGSPLPNFKFSKR